MHVFFGWLVYICRLDLHDEAALSALNSKRECCVCNNINISKLSTPDTYTVDCVENDVVLWGLPDDVARRGGPTLERHPGCLALTSKVQCSSHVC